LGLRSTFRPKLLKVVPSLLLVLVGDVPGPLLLLLVVVVEELEEIPRAANKLFLVGPTPLPLLLLLLLLVVVVVVGLLGDEPGASLPPCCCCCCTWRR
jgi:hypothetical protein